MLLAIHIDNFMLFEKVSIEVSSPFVVVTGETGAGKSLFLQSLRFLSGGKKPSSPPPFQDLPTSVACLIHRDALNYMPAEAAELINSKSSSNANSAIEIRRSLTPQGKSKMTIDGHPANTALVKGIMQAFFEINAQHQHLTVLEERTQRILLDRYTNVNHQLSIVSSTYHNWQSLLARQKKLQIALAGFDDIDYLQSVIEDINQLALHDLDLDGLHQEQKRLHGRQTFLQGCQSLLQRLDGEHEHAIAPQLFQAQHALDDYHDLYPKTSDISQCLRDAATLSQEAVNGLQSVLDYDYSADAERLNQIERQLSATHDCARKYRLQPEALLTFADQCLEQIEKHHQYTQELSGLAQKITDCETEYHHHASELSKQRTTGAEKLTAHILSQLPSLNLPHALFHINVRPNRETPSEHGSDTIEFLFSGNPGIALSRLSDCASGGELARIALLLTASIPAQFRKTLIFDEADVGVSGKTASMIGQLMGQIAHQHQIICLTHSPQVAACGQQHWHIVKQHSHDKTLTKLQSLDKDAHIREVARLLSGMDVSEESLASARKLCEQS